MTDGQNLPHFGSDSVMTDQQKLPPIKVDVEMPRVKPPLGIKPRHVFQHERFLDLQNAIERYVKAGRTVDSAWLMEYYEISEYLINWQEKDKKRWKEAVTSKGASLKDNAEE